MPELVKITYQKTITSFVLDTGFRRSFVEISKDFLFCNMIHGGKDGTVSIEVANNTKVNVKNINNLRALIFMLFDVKDNGESLLINPCFPEAVLNRHKEEIEKQNIIVLSLEDDRLAYTRHYEDKRTYFIYYSGKRVRSTFEECENSNYHLIQKKEDCQIYDDSL